jgi:hypothetical protein
MTLKILPHGRLQEWVAEEQGYFVRGPADLAGVPVGVGYHSDSHFATARALEAVLAPEDG